jgi:hypothetical protein
MKNVPGGSPATAAIPSGRSLMDRLTRFGLSAVTAKLIFCALEKRSHRYIVAFRRSYVLTSMYGFVQSAWPW